MHLTCSAKTTSALTCGAISNRNPELFQNEVMSPSLPVYKNTGPLLLRFHHLSTTHAHETKAVKRKSLRFDNASDMAILFKFYASFIVLYNNNRKSRNVHPQKP